MKKINHITLKIEIDEDGDPTDYLGVLVEKYEDIHRLRNNIAKHCETWIPVDPENPDGEWFSPANHLPHNPKSWDHVSEEKKDKVIAKYGSLRKADIAYAYEDCERLRKFYAGHWWMEGIILKASIAVSDDGTHWAYDEIICSLWGIESDGGEDYKATIVKDLSAELEHELTLWGFSHDEILNAFMEMTTA